MATPLAALANGAPGKLVAGRAGSISNALQPPGDPKARKTAQDFETMFLEQTLERLLASDETEGPLGDNGTGGAVYRSMLVKEYAGGIVKSGGVGIASQIHRELLKLQEASHAGSR